jgi:hypothetical protein
LLFQSIVIRLFIVIFGWQGKTSCSKKLFSWSESRILIADRSRS